MAFSTPTRKRNQPDYAVPTSSAKRLFTAPASGWGGLEGMSYRASQPHPFREFSRPPSRRYGRGFKPTGLSRKVDRLVKYVRHELKPEYKLFRTGYDDNAGNIAMPAMAANAAGIYNAEQHVFLMNNLAQGTTFEQRIGNSFTLDSIEFNLTANAQGATCATSGVELSMKWVLLLTDGGADFDKTQLLDINGTTTGNSWCHAFRNAFAKEPYRVVAQESWGVKLVAADTDAVAKREKTWRSVVYPNGKPEVVTNATTTMNYANTVKNQFWLVLFVSCPAAVTGNAPRWRCESRIKFHD